MKNFLISMIFVCFSMSYLPASSTSSDYSYEFFAESLVFDDFFIEIQEEESFNPAMADSLYDRPLILKKYLSEKEDNYNSLQYRYTYFLEKNQRLAAMMTLFEIVNRAKSTSVVDFYRKNVTSIIFSGVRDARESIMDNKNGDGSIFLDEDVMFFTLFSQFVSREEHKTADFSDAEIFFTISELLFKKMHLFEGWKNDPLLHSTLSYMLGLYKEGLLEGYLGMFFYFITNDSSSVPAWDDFFESYYEKHVMIKKDVITEGELNYMGTVSQLFIAEMFLEKISFMPEVVFVDEKKMEKIKTSEGEKKDSEDDTLCAHIKERHSMMSEFSFLENSALKHNRNLSIMKGCDPDYNFPFRYDKTSVYIPEKRSYMVDFAVVSHLAGKFELSRKEAERLFLAASLSTLQKYALENYRDDFGNKLFYAYITGRMRKFVRALVLQRFYDFEENSEIEDASAFVSHFLFGERFFPEM
ncbi:MAG: hypothetical protein R6W70_06630 [bacterium]